MELLAVHLDAANEERVFFVSQDCLEPFRHAIQQAPETIVAVEAIDLSELDCIAIGQAA
jgi:hypothetical protein